MAEVPADTSPLKYKCEDLVHKKEYRFRIRAVSKIGSSEPATFAKSVLAKDPWGKEMIRFIWACRLFMISIIFRRTH